MSRKAEPLLRCDDDRVMLLRAARERAEQCLGGAAARDTRGIPGAFGGCFVTLWSGAALRGCRGMIGGTEDVVASVAQAAELALTDPRFEHAPVTREELARLDLEVSVLSASAPTSDPARLTPGVHGIVVRRGAQSGCFLPQVATEFGWDAEAFLTACCRMKAGLAADAWRRPGTEVLLFTVDAFRESDLGAVGAG